MKLITLLFASLATSLSACSDDAVNESQPETPNDEPTVSVDKNVTINAGQTFQTIKGFAASDCWTPAFVGKYWTNNRNEIAELAQGHRTLDVACQHGRRKHGTRRRERYLERFTPCRIVSER